MLDVSIRLGVLNLLADLRERERLAILYITHDIASARYLADTIMVMYAGEIVEPGPAATVTDQPSHPYTQLLLAAAPDPDRPSPATLRGRGAPPSLVSPPAGCRFHPRCPYAMAICAQQLPRASRWPPATSAPAGCTRKTQTPPSPGPGTGLRADPADHGRSTGKPPAARREHMIRHTRLPRARQGQ